MRKALKEAAAMGGASKRKRQADGAPGELMPPPSSTPEISGDAAADTGSIGSPAPNESAGSSTE